MNISPQDVIARLGGELVGGNIIVRTGERGIQAAVARTNEGVFTLTDLGLTLWNETENDERVAVARRANQQPSKGAVGQALSASKAALLNDDLKIE
jgi:hypothetical protein